MALFCNPKKQIQYDKTNNILEVDHCMDKIELKKMICEFIDKADEDDISYSVGEHMISCINSFGNFIYKPSGKKELRLNAVVDEIKND